MRKTKRTMLAAALAVGLAFAQEEASAQFSGFYFFGDSLTDAGVYGARFTVHPGLVWAQDLGARYGVTVTPGSRGA
jgi:outer membrane lipase/esterase